MSYTIGSAGPNAGNALILTSAGTISLAATATGTNLIQTFNAPITLAGSYTFTNARVDAGSALVFAGNITNSAASTLTISGAGTGTGNLISGNISDGTGVQSVTISSTAGKWTLSGANSYTGLTSISGTGGTVVTSGTNSSGGATTVTNATLQLNNATNGGLASGLLTMAGGKLEALNNARTLSNAVTWNAGTIQGGQSLTINGKVTGLTGAARTITNTITGANSLTLTDVDINTETANARTMTIAGTGNTTISGVIANGNGTTANGLGITSTGVTTLSGASTYTGATTVAVGSRLNVTGSLGATAVAINAGGTLGGNGTIGTGSSAAGGTVTIVGGTTAATRGTIDLTDGAIGTLTIQGNSTPGTFLTVGGTGTSNSILNFDIGASTVDKIAVTNSGLMTLNAGGATINLTALPSTALANGTYDLITYGSGSTFTGTFTLATTEFGSSRYLLNNTATAEQLIVTTGAGSTAYWTGSQSSTWDTISPATNFTSDAAGTTPTGVPISSTNVYFTANTAANLTTTLGANDFTINSLTLTGTGTSGTGVVTIGGTRTLTLMGTAANGITFEAGAGADVISTKLALGGSQTWQNNNTANALFIDGATNVGANTLTLSGVSGSTYTIRAGMTGTGSLIIDTLGTVNMGAGTSGNAINNTITGGVTINSGTVVLGGGSTGGGTGGVLGAGILTINGGTINATGNIANSSLVLSGQVWNADWTYSGSNKTLKMGTGAINLGTTAGTSRTITTSNAGGILILDGIISDGTTANNLIKAGVGTLTLGSVNTYTGTTTVNGGTLRIQTGDNRLPTSTILAVNGGATATTAGTFDLNALNQSVTGLTGGSGTVKGVVTNNAAGTGTSTITVTGTSTFDGVIKDGATAKVALTKSTGGTLTLTGINTYTGATTVSAGTLLVNGSLTATSSVNVSVGASLGGSGTVAAVVTTAGTGSVISPGNSPGTLNLTGGLDATSGATFVFELGTSSDLLNLGSGVLTGSSAASGLVFNFSDSGGLLAGNPYTLITYGSSSGLNYTDFLASVLPSGYTLDNSFGTNGFLINGTNLQVQFAAVPEPSTFALFGFGLGALWLLRRRRVS